MESTDYPQKPFDTYIPAQSSDDSHESLRKSLRVFLSKLDFLPILLKIKLSLLFKSLFSEKKHSKLFLDGTLLAVTRERKEMVRYFLENMLFILETDTSQAYRLVGPQGIGKTFSLFLLANFLRVPELSEFIKLVYINDATLLTNDGWLPVLEEFAFAFPESRALFAKLKETAVEGEILKAIRLKLNDTNEKGQISVLFCDNLNGLKGPLALGIFDKLKISGWKLKLVCETSGNDTENKHSFLTMNYNSFFHFNELKRLLNEFSPLRDQELHKVQGIVGNSPREGFLLLCQPGNTLEEKVSLYKDKRKSEILASFSQFLTSRSSKFAAKVYKSTYYLDKELFLPYLPAPEIDRQWMLFQKEKLTYNFKVLSIFPFVKEVLTEFMENLLYEPKLKEIDKDFFEMRMQELREHVSLIATDKEKRACFYEEYFFVRAKYSCFLKEKIEWYFFPSNYFNKYLKQFGWDALSNSIRIDFVIEKVVTFEDLNAAIQHFLVNYNVNCLFKSLHSDYDTQENFVYLAKNSYKLTFNKKTESLNPYLDEELPTLIVFQLKKDLEVCFEQYGDIEKQWKVKKEEILKQINGLKINVMLMIVNEAMCRETQETRNGFNLPGFNDVFFLFTDKLNFRYFKY